MVWYCRNSLAHGKENYRPITAANITIDRVYSFINPTLVLNFKYFWRKVHHIGNVQWELQSKLIEMDHGFRKLKEEVSVV